MLGNPKPATPTDKETADLAELLKKVQEVIEAPNTPYAPGLVANVCLNIAARYAARAKWPTRHFKKVCEAVYRRQKKNVEKLEESADQKKQDEASQNAN